MYMIKDTLILTNSSKQLCNCIFNLICNVLINPYFHTFNWYLQVLIMQKERTIVLIQIFYYYKITSNKNHD